MKGGGASSFVFIINFLPAGLNCDLVIPITSQNWEKSFPYTEPLKFGDGDGPNLCREKK